MKTERGAGLPYIDGEAMCYLPATDASGKGLDMRSFPHSENPNTMVVHVMLIGAPILSVVALRAIPKGETFSFNHTTTFAKCCCGCPKSVCDQCGQIAKLSGCGKCRTAWYCSKECQTAAWPMHKAECGM